MALIVYNVENGNLFPILCYQDPMVLLFNEIRPERKRQCTPYLLSKRNSVPSLQYPTSRVSSRGEQTCLLTSELRA